MTIESLLQKMKRVNQKLDAEAEQIGYLELKLYPDGSGMLVYTTWTNIEDVIAKHLPLSPIERLLLNFSDERELVRWLNGYVP